MENIVLTPAQEAKAFAERNGFEIKPNARRYRITRKDSDVTIAEVGGYPAALNAMRTQLSADGLRAVLMDHGIDMGNVGAADSQCVESGADAAVIDEDGTVHIPNRVVPYEENKESAIKQIADSAAQYFEEADEATRDRIRQRAANMRQKMTHVVMWRFGNSVFYSLQYPSYASALKAVRQLMPNKRMRPSYVEIRTI